jgi:predicted dehydrogenase
VERVRIGLVGYGKGGRFFHAPLIAAAAGCELAGVVARSAARRADLEHDHPGMAAYDDLAQLAAAGVDAVTISTPADTHVPLVLEAVSLGLPVVCDKPFALSSAAARQAVAAAERAGVLLTVYQNRRFDADLLTVRAVLDSGEVGSPGSSRGSSSSRHPAGSRPRVAGSCSTWARTSSTRRCCCSARLRRSTPSWTMRAARRAGSSSRCGMPEAWCRT